MRLASRRDWPRLLEELSTQVGDGRNDDRDLAPLRDRLGTVLAVIGHRARFLS